MRPAAAAPQPLSERDRTSNALGMTLIELGTGYACMKMTVREDMANLHGSAHGGMIFALADSTFGYACNSYGKTAVASSCSIDFLRPAHPGDTLTATAVEQALVGRNGVYDVRIENHRGETVALFRGKSTQLRDKAPEKTPARG